MKKFARKKTLESTFFEELRDIVEDAIEFARTGVVPCNTAVSAKSVKLAIKFCAFQDARQADHEVEVARWAKAKIGAIKRSTK